MTAPTLTRHTYTHPTRRYAHTHVKHPEATPCGAGIVRCERCAILAQFDVCATRQVDTGTERDSTSVKRMAAGRVEGGEGAFCVIVPFVSNLFLYFSVILLITAPLPLFGAFSLCVCVCEQLWLCASLSVQFI